MFKPLILVIDDEPETVTLVKERLEANEYEVITAFSGKEGYVKACQSIPSVIILDLLMPLTTGYELCEKLKQNPRTINIPIVVLTAVTDKELLEKALSLGVRDCIIKPFNIDIFLKVLSNILKPQDDECDSSKKKILVVDDEQHLVEVLKMRMEANDYKVIVAFDGEEGLRKARNMSPDLILLDVMLPKINGYRICRILKFDAKYRNVPVIMLTMKNKQDDIQLGLKSGADAYITKPFNAEQLMEKVAELLSRKKKLNFPL